MSKIATMRGRISRPATVLAPEETLRPLRDVRPIRGRCKELHDLVGEREKIGLGLGLDGGE
ncbi:MAG: hypothetical protein A2V77_03055 [Anaeromyxobacter sp. RBG_16_69_14]|nr:MAG: hypothetical protein A2V77_03055 [Anaeromyxobacter sp. RBG_16_69_14]